MNEIFLKVINMSISSGWLILAVLMLRLFLKKTPKWVNVLLWGIVAIRLICPFTIESSVSMIPDSVGNGELVSEWMDDYIGNVDIHHPDSAYYDAAIGAGREAISDGTGSYYVVTKHNQLDEPDTVENTVIPILFTVWVAGMTIMALYTVISYCRLRRKLATAVRYKDNIYQNENVSSPFVLGIIKPKIYLPFKIDAQEMELVIAHELAHIRRKDHWWKPLGFLLLTIHWFNPLIWLAYTLLGRDIELACDEKVIRGLGREQRADYTQALVACSVNRRRIAACPLAFGEVGVKERVKSVMNYKKTSFWVIVLAVISCVIVAVCFLTNPKQDSFSLRIVVPAGSQEQFVYADEEISSLGNRITVTSGEGLGDTEVVLVPVQIKTETAYEPSYLTPGMSVKLDAEKGGWFRIGINMQNDTNQDKIVYVNVENVEVRIESTRIEPTRIEEASLEDIRKYRTDYIGDTPKVCAIAELLPYPKDYCYSSIELQTQTEPYELIVHLTGEAPVEKKDFEGCAAASFDLISNMGVITFCKEESDETIASFVRTKPDKVKESVLDTAIHQAILEHFSDGKPDGLCHVESHVLFANEVSRSTPKVDKDTHIEKITVYLLVLYETYSTYGGELESVGGAYIPTAITFSIGESGEYALEEYWEPRDGDYYEKDIRERFPGKAAEDVLNDQEYIEELQTQNYNKAIDDLNNNGGLELKIAALLDVIQSSPEASSNVKDYIDAHKEEYQELTGYGEYTLRYCFSEFMEGGQTDLRGQIMRAAIDDIAPEAQLKIHTATGQEYFDAWKENAMSIRNQHDMEWIEKYQPSVSLLSEMINEIMK